MTLVIMKKHATVYPGHQTQGMLSILHNYSNKIKEFS